MRKLTIPRPKKSNTQSLCKACAHMVLLIITYLHKKFATMINDGTIQAQNTRRNQRRKPIGMQTLICHSNQETFQKQTDNTHNLADSIQKP